MPNVNNADDEYLTVLDALALTPDPVFAVNDRRRIIFWNKGMKRLLGFEYDEVVGKLCASTIAGRDAFGNRYCGENCAIFAIVQRGESVRPFRLTMKTKSGEPAVVEVIALKFEMRGNHRPLLAYVLRRAEDAVPVAETRTEAQAPAPVRRSADPRLDELTAREAQVLGMVATGKNAEEVARLLGISPFTARNHMRKVFMKIEVHSKAEAVAFAYRTHLV